MKPSAVSLIPLMLCVMVVAMMSFVFWLGQWSIQSRIVPCPKPEVQKPVLVISLNKPPCARRDPTGALLAHSFATQAWGEEWVYECNYEQGEKR